MNILLTQEEIEKLVKQAISRNNGVEYDIMRDTLVELLVLVFPDYEFTLNEAAAVEKIIDLLINFSVTTSVNVTVQFLNLLSEKMIQD